MQIYGKLWWKTRKQNIVRSNKHLSVHVDGLIIIGALMPVYYWTNTFCSRVFQMYMWSHDPLTWNMLLSSRMTEWHSRQREKVKNPEPNLQLVLPSCLTVFYSYLRRTIMFRRNTAVRKTMTVKDRVQSYQCL